MTSRMHRASTEPLPSDTSPRRTGRLPIPGFTPGNGSETDADSLVSSPDEAQGYMNTPTLAEAAGNMKRTLSVRSLKDLEEASRSVTRQIWRKQNESKKRPRNLERLLVHSVQDSARAFILGFSLRSSFNVAVALLRQLQRRKLRILIILHAIFHTDSLRFGGLFGAFVFLWKTTLHSLRLYNPGPLGPKHEEWWHASVAGAISGLAILAERKSRRITIAQQLGIRGMQGLYNMGKSRGMPTIPYGSVWLFGLGCGQIMYSWLMAPEALPGGYRRWITSAARVPAEVLPYNLARMRHPFVAPPLAAGYKVLQMKHSTSLHKAEASALIDDILDGNYHQPFAPCTLIHPWVDSCVTTQFDRFYSVFMFILPTYLALHSIPPILFKRKQFAKDPSSMLLQSFKGTLRSSAFLSTFVVIFQSLFCLKANIYDSIGHLLPGKLLKALLSKYYFWIIGFATCFSLFIEESKRRRELALYVLPRAFESLWSIARNRRWVPLIPGGEVLLSMVGLSLVMNSYHREPASLGGLVRSVVFQFAGRS